MDIYLRLFDTKMLKILFLISISFLTYNILFFSKKKKKIIIIIIKKPKKKKTKKTKNKKTKTKTYNILSILRQP